MNSWIHKELSRKTIAIILGVLTLINLGLHLYRASYPAEPVFDEAHFSTYAADYAKNVAYFDIHPPLGKMIYGAALVASGNPFAGSVEFVSFTVTSTPGNEFKVDMAYRPDTYGKFPYILLRIISSLFGLLLPLAFFVFLKTLKLSDITALLGAAFLVFDNALLLETKLILMNGMYLTLGFIALALYLEGKKHVALAGVFLGLAFSVKLMTVSFLGVIVADLILARMNKERVSRAIKFFFSAIATLCVIYLLNFAVFPLADNINLARKLLGAKDRISIENFSALKKTLYGGAAFLQDIDAGLSGYLYGAKDHPLQSSWYEWPIAKKSMLYFDSKEKTGNLVLVGNYAVWFLGSAAALYAFLWLLAGFYKRYKQKGDILDGENIKIPFLLFAGYFASLAPYFSAVNRSTFLYHYFPGLIFSVGLLCWLLEKKIKKPWQLAAVLLLVILSFALEAGCTYGFSCPVL